MVAVAGTPQLTFNSSYRGITMGGRPRSRDAATISGDRQWPLGETEWRRTTPMIHYDPQSGGTMVVGYRLKPVWRQDGAWPNTVGTSNSHLRHGKDIPY
ncbi:hypothetical protein FA13DRAFT_1729838 [Coprinellus micaceus]|uniref:Uncharacterized protein n=1 Tax=Coprinellus micaceus TaxID=71717 RepID=A0A4Y7TJH6_COPMI|nr:hypothetical protein FA13DRAFT_1729838 [Coprinellus micaceus]